ncbi:uncharacterized protein [Ciconia boyciana]|uniref:uncharacterized protein n=1 Tax=Ciconia boyciana TaxID=52775 RepID=UPI003BA3376F
MLPSPFTLFIRRFSSVSLIFSCSPLFPLTLLHSPLFSLIFPSVSLIFSHFQFPLSFNPPPLFPSVSPLFPSVSFISHCQSPTFSLNFNFPLGLPHSSLSVSPFSLGLPHFLSLSISPSFSLIFPSVSLCFPTFSLNFNFPLGLPHFSRSFSPFPLSLPHFLSLSISPSFSLIFPSVSLLFPTFSLIFNFPLGLPHSSLSVSPFSLGLPHFLSLSISPSFSLIFPSVFLLFPTFSLIFSNLQFPPLSPSFSLNFSSPLGLPQFSPQFLSFLLFVPHVLLILPQFLSCSRVSPLLPPRSPRSPLRPPPLSGPGPAAARRLPRQRPCRDGDRGGEGCSRQGKQYLVFWSVAGGICNANGPRDSFSEAAVISRRLSWVTSPEVTVLAEKGAAGCGGGIIKSRPPCKRGFLSTAADSERDICI